MKRVTLYSLGLIAMAVFIALHGAVDRFFDFIFGKMPNWAGMMVAFGLAAAAIALAAWEQSKRPKPPSPFCVKCGYDLRATPHRCPECGTIPPEKRKVANRKTPSGV